MNEEYLNKLSREIHEHNAKVGWWGDDVCIFEKIQLISTEVAEATEGVRKGLMDDKLPQYKMEGVELADALIRTLDIGSKLGFKYVAIDVDYEHPFISKESSSGKNHLAINMQIINLAKLVAVGSSEDISNYVYSELVRSILEVAKVRGHSIAKMVADKREYNLNRADHKLENRAKKGGKKF